MGLQHDPAAVGEAPHLRCRVPRGRVAGRLPGARMTRDELLAISREPNVRLTNDRSKSAFERIPAFQSASQGLKAQPILGGPIGHCLGPPVVSEQARGASVPLLLRHRRPSTVLGTVASIVVDSIDGKPGGTVSHVGEKVSVIHPSFANGDAAPAVIGVEAVRRVCASVQHGPPYVVSGELGRSAVHARGRVTARRGLAREASARRGMPGRQTLADREVFGSAVASASPSSLLVARDAVQFKNDAATEPLPGQIPKVGSTLRIHVSHCRTSFTGWGVVRPNGRVNVRSGRFHFTPVAP